jgi:hypothetical protein
MTTSSPASARRAAATAPPAPLPTTTTSAVRRTSARTSRPRIATPRAVAGSGAGVAAGAVPERSVGSAVLRTGGATRSACAARAIGSASVLSPAAGPSHGTRGRAVVQRPRVAEGALHVGVAVPHGEREAAQRLEHGALHGHARARPAGEHRVLAGRVEPRERHRAPGAQARRGARAEQVEHAQQVGALGRGARPSRASTSAVASRCGARSSAPSSTRAHTAASVARRAGPRAGAGGAAASGAGPASSAEGPSGPGASAVPGASVADMARGARAGARRSVGGGARGRQRPWCGHPLPASRRAVTRRDDDAAPLATTAGAAARLHTPLPAPMRRSAPLALALLLAATACDTDRPTAPVGAPAAARERAAASDPTPSSITLEKIGGYAHGGAGASEITAYDHVSKRLFVVNGALRTVDVLDLRDPANPTKVATLDVRAIGGAANSVDAHNGVVAVAVEGTVKTEPGTVALYRATTLQLISTAPVGALPDMLTFTPTASASSSPTRASRTTPTPSTPRAR